MLKLLLKQRVPGQLVVQVTDRCNATCPQCGMRVSRVFPRSRLESGRLFSIIDAAAEKGIQALSFTGGEPLLIKDDLLILIRHAVDSGIPYVRTGTNGFVFMGSESRGFERRIGRLAEELAGSGLRNFWISLDSAVPEIHESMRGLPGVVEGIRKALPIFHRNGLYPSANLGINRNLTRETRDLDASGTSDRGDYLNEFYRIYRQGFRDFYTFVVDMGFTIVNSCYPMSVDPDEHPEAVYSAGSPDRVVRFSKDEKVQLYRALFETIPEFRRSIRIFSPRVSLYSLMQETSETRKGYPCRGGIDFFFIDAKKGHVYPCGYRGREDLGPLKSLDLEGLKTGKSCRECHWECFRDPSEMAGPVLDAVRRPFGLLGDCLKDRTRARLWFDDFRYYRACGWFDGRKPPVFR